jgi:anaerobic selenocysteine-containing dehydrogenase
LPALSFAERDGTFTNAERRVQRYTQALPPLGQAKADWEIIRMISDQLGLKWMVFTAEAVMDEIAANVIAYTGLTYTALAQTKEAWPPVGSNDLYFGGTAYDNRGGVGLQAKSLVEIDGRSEMNWIEPPSSSGEAERRVTKLNRHGTLIDQSAVYHIRLVEAEKA